MSREELWARVSERDAQHEADPNAIFFSESDLLRSRGRFVPTSESTEPHLLHDGDSNSVLRELGKAFTPTQDVGI